MIDVVITTWPNHPKRLEYFRQTLLSMVQGLTASRHKLRYLCSAETQRDPASEWCGDGLAALCADHGVSLHWRHAPASLGANMNAALRPCVTPSRLLVQDDCPLIVPLDLSDGAEIMEAERGISLIRYEWPPQPHRTTLHEYGGGWRQFELVNRCYGDRANLFPSWFAERHGWFAEGGGHGNSEWKMSDRLKNDGAVILAPLTQHFAHIQGVPSVVNDNRSRQEKR